MLRGDGNLENLAGLCVFSKFFLTTYSFFKGTTQTPQSQAYKKANQQQQQQQNSASLAGSMRSFSDIELRDFFFFFF